MNLKTILSLAFCILLTSARATTWDEPWQDKVIKEADSFVFAKIKSTEEDKGVTIDIQRTLAGKKLKGEIEISDFYLLRICSSSAGHGPEFHFDKRMSYYFFIKQNEKGKYCIATPSTGFAPLDDGKVAATYRHSYHRALVPADIYENTMTAIFNNYHNTRYDKKYIEEFVNKNLSLKPAGFGKDEINTFFAQHAALECIYHLRLKNYYSKILPFLNDTTNFHHQISGARALVSCNSSECKQVLLNTISDSTRDDFVQVMCIWTLSEFKPGELKEQLLKLTETASTRSNGFGGNIMDPRVCTSLPNVKNALSTLIESL